MAGNIQSTFFLMVSGKSATQAVPINLTLEWQLKLGRCRLETGALLARDERFLNIHTYINIHIKHKQSGDVIFQ